MKESEDKIQDPYISLHWYEPIGSGGTEEKEVCFDSLKELGQFLRENLKLAEKVGYG